MSNTTEKKFISLKEAFRYQNYLRELLEDAVHYLSIPANVTTVTAIHKRSAAFGEAKDETVTIPAADAITYSANKVVEFIKYLLNQRDILADAITVAKRSAPVDIDSACALNKTRQRIARTLMNTSRIKASERVLSGTAYKLNAEGNQVPYRYDIHEKTEINFDRNTMRKLADTIIRVADDNSAKVDRALVDVKVEYTEPFNITCSWEEALEKFNAQSSVTDRK